jgi:hypothetical protein
MIDRIQWSDFGHLGAGLPSALPPGHWLTLIIRAPIREVDAHMRVSRTLESLGSVQLTEGVHVLPRRDDLTASLDELCNYIIEGGTPAEVVILSTRTSAQEAGIRAAFDRSERYATLVRTVNSLSSGLELTEASAVSRVLARQHDELARLVAIDYFPGEAQRQALQAMETAEAAVKAALFPVEGGATLPRGCSSQDFFHRVWVTRQPLWADRLASAWLIRRFIDVESHLIWLDRDNPVPSEAISFGFTGAQFQNSPDRITFDQLVRYFRLDEDASLGRMASLVRDVETGQRHVAESGAIELLLEGATRRAERAPDALLEAAEQIFDQVYEAFLDHPKKARRLRGR